MASENDQPDNEDVKKKALARLAVAGLVTATALGGLWWLDQGNQAPSKTAAIPTTQPAPIRPAQTPEPALPQVEPMSEALKESTPQVEPNGAAAPQEAPPPPRVSNPPRLPASIPDSPPSRPGHAPTQAAPLPQPQVQLAPSALPATSAGGHFVVQLGVFSNPNRAEELVRHLKEKGIRASTETRVHVGPFMNRQEAEKAQAEMRRLGLEGVITTAATTK